MSPNSNPNPAPDPALFPADDSGAVPVEKPELGGVDKTFRPYQPNQILLMPPSLDEWLPQNHLSRFVSELVDETLELDAIYASYIEKRGYPPYDPRMMVKLLIYGYTTGHRSSRGIERRCFDDVAFRYLAGGDQPDYRSIARFRRRHLGALAGFFVQALELCKKAGMVRLGQVAVDGTKLRANASRRKAMSYGRMVKREPELEAEIAAILAEAEKVDTAEDARLGKDNRDDDLPGELARRETRLARIRKAKAELEAEAQQAAAVKATEKARKQGMTEAQVDAAAAEAAAKAVPKDKAQRNFTDPESRIMKTSDGSFHQCYNGQAAVDAEHQVIVAADLDACAADAPSLLPMLDAVIANTGATPDQFLADAGYCSEDNLEGVDKREVDAYISTRRRKHHESDEPPPPADPGSARPSRRERMALKLRTDEGKKVYARRKAIVEPVFGQMDTLQAMRKLLLRGEEQALGEWLLTCGCHNLRKLFNYRLTGPQGAGGGLPGLLAAA
jgi:transposase